jgi:hypothetical protein
MVFRNGGMIQSFVPPSVLLTAHRGRDPDQLSVNSPQCSIIQSKVLGHFAADGIGGVAGSISHAFTEIWAFNHYRRLRLSDTLDMTAAASVLNRNHFYGQRSSAQHFSGYASWGYASVPPCGRHRGGNGPTLALNANSNDLSGYVTVTTGISPAASRNHRHGDLWHRIRNAGEVSLWPANAAASALTGAGQAYIPVGSNTAFTIASGHDGPGGIDALHLGAIHARSKDGNPMSCHGYPALRTRR